MYEKPKYISALNPHCVPTHPYTVDQLISELKTPPQTLRLTWISHSYNVPPHWPLTTLSQLYNWLLYMASAHHCPSYNIMVSVQLHCSVHTTSCIVHAAHSILHSMLYCTVPPSILAIACCCSATFTGMGLCSKLLYTVSHLAHLYTPHQIAQQVEQEWVLSLCGQWRHTLFGVQQPGWTVKQSILQLQLAPIREQHCRLFCFRSRTNKVWECLLRVHSCCWLISTVYMHSCTHTPVLVRLPRCSVIMASLTLMPA